MSKNKPLILVLEDEKSQRDYYELLLSETGFNVKSYSYYEDAVAALDIYEFHAFVVDLKVDVKEQKNAGAGGDSPRGGVVPAFTDEEIGRCFQDAVSGRVFGFGGDPHLAMPEINMSTLII